MMKQNKLDFAILPTVMAANLYNKGVHFKIVSIPIWGILYILSNKKDGATYKQLEGKTIAVFRTRCNSRYLIARIYQIQGLT